MSEDKPLFSERLKELRKLRRLSIREAAKRIGVPESTYREWEYGRQITGEPYPQIAKAFNVTLEELFGVDPLENSLDTAFARMEFLIHSMKKKMLRPK